jgi:hypothetical protein
VVLSESAAQLVEHTAMLADAYDQIDKARTELEAVSK